MPPRAAQKRKADDGPYALSGLKRPAGNGGSSNQALYATREHRDRDGFAVNTMREREMYGVPNGYEKDISPHGVINPSSKRRKADPSNGGPAYYQTGMVGNLMMRGEEGPLLTLDMATLPFPSVIKYLQANQILPLMHPSPLSAQRPNHPHVANLKPPPSTNAAASNRNRGPWDDLNGQTSTVKTSVRNTFSNGAVTSASAALYSTSTLGLSGAEPESSPTEDFIAMCDVEEARIALASLAQSHWCSVSSAFVSPNPTSNGYPLSKMSEREVVDEFMVSLRSKELAVRLTL